MFRPHALPTAVVVLVCAAVAGARVRPGPDGDAFYTPPSPMPAASPGEVVWARPYTGDAALPHAARNVLVLYHSRTVDGRDVAVSGVVSFPRRPRGADVLSWGHGTTGGADVCAPSRSEADAPDRAYVQQIAGVLDAWVQAGWVVVQTDYEGLGTPGDHPYIVGASEMRGMTDIVRAARRLDRRIGRRWIAAGHSQGGHAALFAAALAPDWAPELRLRGAVAIAPGSHQALIPTLLQAQAADVLQGVIGYVPLLFVGAGAAGGFDAATALTSEAITAARSVCATGLFVEFLGRPLTDIVPPNADVARVGAVFDANEPQHLDLAVPTLVVQGTADTEIFPELTRQVIDDYCARSQPVEYRTVEAADHVGAVTGSVDLVANWVRARVRRARFTPLCPP